jgi:hypothetical protein
MKSRDKQPDKWADEVLSSIDGIKKAQAHPETYNRVMRNLTQVRQPAQATILARPAVRWSLAFGLAVLAALNVFTIVSNHSASQAQSASLAQSLAQSTVQSKETTPSSAFAEEYFSYMNNL